MDYNDLLQELKNKHFPELQNDHIKLKPLKLLKKTFMIALPFSKNIHYNIRVIERCGKPALKAVLIHELCHRVQFKKMNFFQKMFLVPRYHLSEKFRRQHEIEAHMDVVKRGFGKELIELNKFVKLRYQKKNWDEKLSNYYLTEEEINKLILNKI